MLKVMNSFGILDIKKWNLGLVSWRDDVYKP